MNKENLKRGILVPFTLLIFSLLIAFVIIVNRYERGEMDAEWQATLKKVGSSFPAEIDLRAGMMDAVLSSIVLDEALGGALMRKDRDALLNKSRPLFQQLLSKHKVTHFYFTGPDRVNILRVHQPQRYGDTISRFTTLTAEKTGKPARGVELGPLGTFTLRVVFPWFAGERLIGYVELGMEIEHVYKEIEEDFGVRLLPFIRKGLIERAGWEDGMRMLGHEISWERFPSVVYVGAPLKRVPDKLAELLAGEEKTTVGKADALSLEGRHYHFEKTPLTDAAGREIGHIAIMLDETDEVATYQRLIATFGAVALFLGAAVFVIFYLVTGRVERKLNDARMSLFREKNYVGNIIKNMADALFVLNPDATIRSVNRAALNLLGYEEDELIGRSAGIIFAEEEILFKGTGVRDLIKRGAIVGLEKNCLAKNGRKIPVIFSGSVMRDEKERMQAVVCVALDITERKQAEAAIRKLNNELEQKVIARTAALEQAKLKVEQASRGKDEFLAAISHELKTPLNHILGFADLLKEGLAGELNAEQKGMAQDIFDAGSKQLAIVNSLIELARLQAGKVKLQAELQDPAKMLGEIATRHAAKAQVAGLAFAVEVAEGLGEMPLDREVVTHLLDQLLANAFKFTPSGGKVSLTARRVPHTDVAAPVRVAADEYLELAVADNGPGVAPEILPRLFQPFVQGDGRLARSHQGTGAGLMIVKLLAELHGGGSGVESEPGTGAKFLVWLPCGAAPTS